MNKKGKRYKMSKKIVRKITSIILVVSMALTSITFTDVYAQDQDS